MITKTTFALAGPQGTKMRKQRAIPDQTMSVREIVRRFVKGIPVDVVQRQGVYIDPSKEIDYEKVSRLDFGEKVEFAGELRREAEVAYTELEERAEAERLARDEAKKKAAQTASNEPPKQEKPAGQAGPA